MRKEALLLGMGAFTAPVYAGDTQMFQPAAGQFRQVGHEPAAVVRYERRTRARIAPEKLVPNLRSDLEMAGPNGGTHPSQEGARRGAERAHTGLDHPTHKA